MLLWLQRWGGSHAERIEVLNAHCWFVKSVVLRKTLVNLLHTSYTLLE